MEYQNYEEYMRSVLGYSPQNPNIYESYDNTYYRNEYVNNFSEEEANELYPEIYHLIYPMICKVCETNSDPITRELIEKMTEEVYNAIGETETVVNVRIEAPKEVRTGNISNTDRTENRGGRAQKKTEEVRNSSLSNYEKESVKNREDRVSRPQNSTLRDLIKILILKQLIGGNIRPPVRPPRPPYPGGPGMPPPRPPYPGPRPPMGGGANNLPPMRPRDYEDYLKF